jgi:hypothetical protein
MNVSEIKSIINDYNALITAIEDMLKIVSSIEPEYYNLSQIYQVYIVNDTITIDSCDYRDRDYDSRSVDFPIKWLLLTEEELIDTVTQAREERIRQAELLRAEAQKARQKSIEEYNALLKQKRRLEYEELKKEFEGEE